MQLVRLHWIGTISGRAPPPDALPCTAPASKGGQGRWVVREEERGEMICCGQGKEQKGEGEGGEQSTVHQENAQKQPPANAHASTMHCHIPAIVAGGKRAARERSEGEKSTELPDSTGRGEGGGGTQRVRVAAEMNMWEMLMSADSPTLHRPQGTHTQSKQARGVGM